MIVDWDVHHGNGTEKTFYETDKVRPLAARALSSPCSLAHNVGLGGGDGGDQVLFLSLHRFEPDFYPNSGPLESVGAGEGKGYNINVPWNFFGAGNAEYLHAFEQLVVPVAKAYQPDLVLVSCGFDAAWGDPLGGMTITASGYQQMTRMLLEATNGKVVLALEGIPYALARSFVVDDGDGDDDVASDAWLQAGTTCESSPHAQRRAFERCWARRSSTWKRNKGYQHHFV